MCKLALSELNLSTIKPPTFVLKEENSLAANFSLPKVPDHWKLS